MISSATPRPMAGDVLGSALDAWLGRRLRRRWLGRVAPFGRLVGSVVADRYAPPPNPTPTMAAMDLNADLGESFGRWTLGDDERLVQHITSANLACGFHAGDFRVMEATVALCRRAGVAVGAQPGYPDLLGFGRRPMPFEPDEVESLVRYQIGASRRSAARAASRCSTSSRTARSTTRRPTDPALAGAIARAVGRFSRDLLLFGLASSEPMASAAADAGLRFVPEAFADRAYLPDGTLQPRG